MGDFQFGSLLSAREQRRLDRWCLLWPYNSGEFQAYFVAQAWRRVVLNDPCSYCGSRPSTHWDHVVPRSKGGKAWSADNLVGACKHCNLSKHKTDLVVWLVRHPEVCRG